MLVQKIAGSRYANNTLIFVVEDDAQDGGDHVDSHRSTAYIVGPYVKQGVVISTPYNTLNFLRTMEEVLGLPPMNLNDALAAPMADVFNMTDLTNKQPSPWGFTAAPSALPLQFAIGAASPARRLDRAQAHAQCEVLGARHQRNGLFGRGSCRSHAVQPRSLEGADGQQALSCCVDRTAPARRTATTTDKRLAAARQNYRRSQ